jgi:DNA-binding response OmpR family regulator/HPt (histidine-containing phosphotransfer) domain-containing protein
MFKPTRLLVVEDSQDSRLALELALGSEYSVVFAHTLAEAKSLLCQESFPIVIFDVSLPDGDGLKFFSQAADFLRGRMGGAIFVSGHRDTAQKVFAFENGAFDYILKPFDPLELRARVSAVLRRLPKETSVGTSAALEGIPIQIEDATQRVTYDLQGNSVTVGLTSLEYRILKLLMSRSGRLVMRETILDTIWGVGVKVAPRTIDTHICHLRAKLEGAPLQMRGVKGQGYVLEWEAVASSFANNARLPKEMEENQIDEDVLATWKSIDSQGKQLKEMISTLFSQEKSVLTEIRNALLSRRSDSLADLMHRLKSSTGQLGAKPLSELCATMEKRALTEDFEGVHFENEVKTFENLWRQTREAFEARLA